MSMRLARLPLAAAFMAAALAGCSGGDAAPPTGTPPVAVGSIVGKATAGTDKVPGVTLILSNGAGNVGIGGTNGLGEYAFDNIPPGIYNIQIQTPAGYEFGDGETGFRFNIQVAAGQAKQVDWSLRPKALNGVVEIKVKALTFEPANVTIKAGTKVRWVADSPHFHTITMDNPAQAGGWSEAVVNATGSTFEHTFNVPTTYPYNCAPHRSLGMTGVITVVP